MPAPATLSELIALYLARCRIEGLSPRTQRAYSETLARFQRSVAAQGVPDAAAAVETATVIRYCETFQARRPATRHRYFREVRCFFNWCVAAGFLDHTPFRGLRNVRLPSELVQPFRPAELARLVAACDPATAVGRRDAAVVLLFLDTGIRCAELSALDLADCDLPRRRLLIRHGKGNKQRVVPFARRCRAALEAYLAVRGPTPGPLVWAVTGPGRRIILPLLSPTIAVVGTTLVIFALKMFDLVWVTTGGRFDTDVVATLFFREAFRFRDFGVGAALAVVLLVAVVPLMLVSIRRFQFQEEVR